MPLWTIYLSLAGVVAVIGLIAFREGWIMAHLTETDAIEAYADRYVAEAGPKARRTDCVAKPGASVWLEIRCEGLVGRYLYHVTRWGGLQRLDIPDAARPRM